jgi:hypothetical protein
LHAYYHFLKLEKIGFNAVFESCPEIDAHQQKKLSE